MALTKDQIANRKIGGSSAAAILGISKYRSRYQEYLRMTGQEEEEDLSDNIHIKTGNLLEPAIRRVLGHTEWNVQMEHPEFPYLTGNLDGLDGTTVREYKTVLDWRKDFTDTDIPADYKAQCMHYLLFPGFERVTLYAVFMSMDVKTLIANVSMTADQLDDIVRNLEMREYVIEPDVFQMEWMLEKYAEFWGYVERMEAPPAQNLKELQSIFALSESGAVEATKDCVLSRDNIIRLRSEEKLIKERIEDAKFQICDYMQKKDTLVKDGEKLCTWKSNKNGVRSFRIA